MRRLAALLVLGIGGLLLISGSPVRRAGAGYDSAGRRPCDRRNIGRERLVHHHVALTWSVADPESPQIERAAANPRRHRGHPRDDRHCTAKSDGGTTIVPKTVKIDKTPPTVDPDPEPDPMRSAGIASRSPSGLRQRRHLRHRRLHGRPALQRPRHRRHPHPGSCTTRPEINHRPVPLKYDATPPMVDPIPLGTDVNGWYNHPLFVDFAGGDTTSGVTGALPSRSTSARTTSLPSSTAPVRTRLATFAWLAVFKYDATEPQVEGASPDRGPDQNSWYNQPLTVRFHGSDATSQIAACTVARYAGPTTRAHRSRLVRRPRRQLERRERLGSGTTRASRAHQREGQGRQPARQPEVGRTPDTNVIEIVRTAGKRSERVRVYRGTGRTFVDEGLENGVRYRDSVTGYDEARNAATRTSLPRRRGRSRHHKRARAYPRRRDSSGKLPRSHVLQRPGLAARQDLQCLADRHVRRAQAHLDLRRSPPAPHPGALPLVRLGRVRAKSPKQVRAPPRLELVRGSLARFAQEPS